ncbi:MAG: methyltransferase domain-containing protein, partial [Chloroflexota bacterium]|nr:methyltransferase domain-containing protein [Chloroflexota bacterium]
ALARRNAEKVGARNVSFLKGDLEAIPLPDRSVDVIISNCVINLTPDKSRALREAFRVLRPGGRLAVSDIVVDGDFKGLPISEEQIRASLSWAGCIAGALTVDDYRRLLAEAGFRDIAIEPKRLEDMFGTMPDNLPDALLDLPVRVLKELMRRFASASISAVRPAEAA